MLMLDICAGLGGASKAMKERGWQVITVDINPDFHPDIIADITTWSWHGQRPDLIWCSPPCDEFSRESMPWCKTGATPSMALVNACKRIIAECQPRYWVIENVRGAVPYIGKWREHHGAFYLWGSFPPIGKPTLNHRKKESIRGKNQAAERAVIPYNLSLSLAQAIEWQGVLL